MLATGYIHLSQKINGIASGGTTPPSFRDNTSIERVDGGNYIVTVLDDNGLFNLTDRRLGSFLLYRYLAW